jgi:hypothetical protein
MSTIKVTRTGTVFPTIADVAPLTTIWTPPASYPPIVSFQEVVQLSVTSYCVPPDYVYVWWEQGYYSPGVCLSGYTIGCTGSGTLNGLPIRAEETAAVCVPR